MKTCRRPLALSIGFAFLLTIMLTGIPQQAHAAYTVGSKSLSLVQKDKDPGIGAQTIDLRSNGKFPAFNDNSVSKSFSSGHMKIGTVKTKQSSDYKNALLINFKTITTKDVAKLRFKDMGVDSNRDKIDMRLTISNFHLKKGNNNKEDWFPILCSINGRLHAASWGCKSVTSPRSGVRYTVTVEFLKAGTNKAASGNYILFGRDIDITGGGGDFREHVELQSGFEKSVFIFDKSKEDGFFAASDVKKGLIVNSTGKYSDDTKDWRAAFAVRTTGPTFKFEWGGSECSTVLFYPNMKDIKITEQTDEGCTIASTSYPTATSYTTAKTRSFPWKPTEKYTVQAKKGYYVTRILTKVGGKTVKDSTGLKIEKDSRTFKELIQDGSIRAWSSKLASTNITLSAKKKLTGATLKNKQFSFQLKEGNKVLQTKTCDANGNVTFDKITYAYTEEDKTHNYTITEVNDKQKDITYDNHTLKVAVKISRNKAGTGLDAKATYTGDQTFTNKYAPPAPGTVQLTAKKVLKNGTLAANQFSFVLKEGSKTLQTKKNAADGSIKFDAIKYSAADEGKKHTYEITEVNEKKAGFTYDTHTLKATVSITRSGGNLKAVASYSGNQTFTNTAPKVNAVKASLSATKKLEGAKLAANQFSFQLKENNKVLQTKKNAADGSIKFDAISYSSAGTHNYEIVEVKGNAAGMQYDTHPLKARVTVTQSGYTLKAAVTYPSGSKVFTNKQNGYKINFNANGGSGTMSPQGCDFGKAITLNANKFTRTGYTFLGWKDANKGNIIKDKANVGKDYVNKDGSEKTLYAQWQATPYTLLFNNNKAQFDKSISPLTGSISGTMANQTLTYDKVGKEKITKNAFTSSQSSWVKWNTKADGTGVDYTNEKLIDKKLVDLAKNNGGKVTLYAQWTPPAYNIKFDKNAAKATGTTAAMNNLRFSDKKKLTKNGFSRKGYKFKGWSRSNNGSKIDFTNQQEVTALATAPNQTITLYALWDPQTVNINLKKVSSANHAEGLAGVPFTLSGKDIEGNTVSKNVTSAADGTIALTELPFSDSAGYTITETKTPEGFKTPAKPWNLKVSTDGTATISGGANNNASKLLFNTPIGSPEISLEKTANPTTVKAGEKIVYSFKVKNEGTVTINKVRLTDAKLGIDQEVSASLAGGESTTLTLTDKPYTPTQAEVDAGKVVNTASVTGTPVEGTLEPAEDTCIVVVEQSADLELVKTATPESVGVGGEITYSITATNKGTSSLTNLELSDPLLGLDDDKTLKLDSLAPGASKTWTAPELPKLTATAAHAKAGKVDNTASITADSPTGSIEKEASVSTPVTSDNKLLIEKTGKIDSTVPKVGDMVTWTFKITNQSQLSLDNIAIADELLTERGISVDIELEGALEPGKDVTATAQMPLTAEDINSGEVVNTATATADDPVDSEKKVTSNEATATVKVEKNPAIEFKKEADTKTITIGGKVYYTFTATNTGSTTLNNLTVKDPRLNIENLSMDPANIEPGQSATATAEYTVTAEDAKEGVIKNIATVTAFPEGSDTPIEKTAEADVTVVTAQTLKLVKTAEPSVISKAKAGDKVKWNFTVTNEGTMPVSNIVINDDLLTARNIKIAFPADALPVGESRSVSAEMELTQADIDAGEILNIAVAVGDDPIDPSKKIGSDEAKALVNIDRSAQLKAEKKALDKSVPVGGTAKFEIVATNVGNVTLTKVVADDPLTGDTNLLIADTLAPGASASVQVEYKPVTDADAIKGFVENTVTITALPPEGVKDMPPAEAKAKTKVDSKPKLDLVKKANPEKVANAMIGSEIEWTFDITNSGDVTVRDITIEDKVLKERGIEVKVEPSTLAPGESVHASAKMPLTQEDIAKGEVFNTAIAHGVGPDGKIKSDPSEAKLEIERAGAVAAEAMSNQPDAKLEISKSGDGTPIIPILAFGFGAAVLLGISYYRRRFGAKPF